MIRTAGCPLPLAKGLKAEARGCHYPDQLDT